MSEELKLDEHRIRQRKEFHKHILCYKCDVLNPENKIKIPFVFEVNDISYSGIGILTSTILYSGVKLYFRLDVDELKREFCVQVVWSKYSGDHYVSGLKFIDVNREDIIFLHMIIRRL